MEVINKIEENLSKLMELVDEDTYVDIILNNELLSLYDRGMMLEEDNIFSDEFLNKILDIVSKELENRK